MESNRCSRRGLPGRGARGAVTGVPDGPADTLGGLVTELRERDRRVGRVIGLIWQAQDDAASEILEGLPLDHLLGLRAGRRRGETRGLLVAADMLRDMPRLYERLRIGGISWAAVRSVAYEVRVLDADQRRAVDQALDERYRDVPYEDLDPDRLVDEVTDAVLELRPELERARERRSFAGRRLAIQPYLDGSGGEVHATLDALGLATVDNALSSQMDHQLQTGETCADDGLPARRADALVAMAQHTLASGPGTRNGTKPKPTFHVLVDAADLASGGGGLLLWRRPGRVPRLSRIAIEQLSRDADVHAVLTRHGIPIAPEPTHTVEPPAALRRRVFVRDAGRCRFPRCGRAADDLHHLERRADGGTHTDSNTASMCRWHNLLLERHRWRQQLLPDGTYQMTRPGRTYTTTPLRRAPLDLTPPNHTNGPP